MDPLPVPPLTQTLQKYLVAVQPLLSRQEQDEARDAVQRTLDGVGPVCQSALEEFAASERTAGRSWLSTAWLRGYLDVRTPLPLTSSVGFQIRPPVPRSSEPGAAAASQVSAQTHTAHAAHAAGVIQRLAGVHLAWLRGELPVEQTPRGERVCGLQREVLAGGLRHPGTSTDEFRPADDSPQRREVGLLVDDRFVVAQVSDSAGHPLARETLAQSIQEALHRADLAGPALDPGFTAVSYLGSARASAYLDRLLDDPANQRVYERLAEVLFVVHLDRAAGSTQEHLWRAAFSPGQAWAYTPITYQVSLVDDFVGMHLEHSQVDAATLKAVLRHAQSDVWTARADPAYASAPVESVEWTYPDDLATELRVELDAYQQEAGQLRLDTVRVARPVPADLPFRVSDDALCQWMMLYAQLSTYERVRSTYEAVDTRHYSAGRTECLRSVTPEAVDLVRALRDGTAQARHLNAALVAHKEWIKACKTGQGIDRHLTGLASIAAARGVRLPVLDDVSYGRLKTDFLSTSSIGDHDQIVGMCFAPTSEGGLGVNYTALPDVYEFLVTSHRTQARDVGTFVARLDEAAAALTTLLDSLAGERTADQ
ncbi:MAG TPA: choline/carnitine O-acyltransferase [Ornithinimicrobium sp.]|uniref:choline/carnitine O-acyltransferase n=1 Tax=Ornithinimicrobium sp. TaxID=1977084 RepID=UPI002B478C43|nr:choline/carnitine O-acyltransferase [Ornithinimicrobium sp.]HKJ12900.1 choline/carnitine O-acyltransferase [Ornithinimicrobium sp.]